MPLIWVIVFEFSFILLNIVKIILSTLCAYCHCNQYNGTAAILVEQKIKRK